MVKYVLLLVGIAVLAAGCSRGIESKSGSRSRVAIAVTDKGFVPSRVTVSGGNRVTLVVTRETDQTCATEIVVASEGIRKELPLGQPVEITFTPSGKGKVPYTCGMGMLSGAVIVE
jgi:plastocyanin domain-containing protein